jgi:hypothetical protein
VAPGRVLRAFGLLRLSWVSLGREAWYVFHNLEIAYKRWGRFVKREKVQPAGTVKVWPDVWVSHPPDGPLRAYYQAGSIAQARIAVCDGGHGYYPVENRVELEPRKSRGFRRLCVRNLWKT